MSQGLAQAFATAMLAAGNAAVQNAARINSTAIAEAYIAGLQDAVGNCTAATETSSPPNTQAWFQCAPIPSPISHEVLLIASPLPIWNCGQD